MANSNWNICFCKSDLDYLQHLLKLQPGLGEKKFENHQLSLVFDISLLVRIISVTFEGFLFWGRGGGVMPIRGNNIIQ